MDRRVDERYPAKMDVTVTDIAAPERVAVGLVADLSEAGLAADLSLAFDIGAPVKAQLADCALFGHVKYCNQADTDPQQFRIGIEVARVLLGHSGLSSLVNSVLAESIPATPGVKVIPPR